jgi:hypothetical protein
MSRLMADAKVFNLSFGSVWNDPIRFSWISDHLSYRRGQPVRFDAELANSAELFDAEEQLAAHHTLSNKQSLAHNFRATAQTGILRVSYDDFPSDLTYEYVEGSNSFLSEVVAPILSFFQRRRVLIGTVRFISREKWIYVMPPFLAAEWIDSVAFGPITIETADIASALSRALKHYTTLVDEKKDRVRMLLLRYNELLNLPYVHERTEGLWRVIEALGRYSAVSPTVEAEYKRLLPICAAKQSPNLKLLLSALTHYGLTYSDTEIKESRAFRNHATHEYLDSALTSWPSLPDSFHFLHRAVDKAVALELGLDGFAIKDPAFSIIQNRVL